MASPAVIDAKKLLGLAAPVIVTQLGMMTLGVVDMLMVGRVGVHALDASTLGNLWIMGTLIFGMGVVFGIDPIVSQAHGAGDERRKELALHWTCIAALLVSVPIGLMWLFTEEVLLLFGQDPGHSADAAYYAILQIGTVPAFLLFTALRQHLVGQGVAMPSLWVIVGANFLNAGLNGLLIYGSFGFPELGLIGAGVATAITRVCMLIALVAILWRTGDKVRALGRWTRESVAWSGVSEVLRYGLPVGTQYGLEMWAFQITTLVAGRLGAAHLGAHAIVLNLASLSFMVPLGLSFGAATRVGNLIGAGDIRGSHRAARVALALGAGVMSVSAIVFLVLRNNLATLYNPDPDVVRLAAGILPIAATFQLFDGIQVVGGGVLRGMGSTRPAAFFNLIGYYALALPLAWWLAFPCGMGLAGLWWGLALGLAIIATMLVTFILGRERREIRRGRTRGPQEAAA